MYKLLIRPVLFLFDPEKIHHAVFSLLGILFAIPGLKFLFGFFYRVKSKKFERDVFGLKFPNPIGLAAGFDKDGILNEN